MFLGRNQEREGQAENVARVRRWTREILALTEDVLVFVTELECLEEGCPPLETAIVISRSNAEKRQYKIECSVSEVTRDQLLRILAGDRNTCNEC